MDQEEQGDFTREKKKQRVPHQVLIANTLNVAFPFIRLKPIEEGGENNVFIANPVKTAGGKSLLQTVVFSPPPPGEENHL